MLKLYRVNDIKDFDAYFELKSDKDAVAWSGFQTAPDREKLKKYFKEKIVDSDFNKVYYLIDTEGHPVEVMGYVQFSANSTSEVEYRGTSILKKYQGLGLLQEMTEMLFDIIKSEGYKTVIAWVSEKNLPAIFNMQCTGFIKTHETEERELKALGGIHVFYKWVKEL